MADRAGHLWNIFFQALYPAWGLAGIFVCFTYGRVTNKNWREAGGQWRSAPLEWIGIALYVLGGCVRDVWHVARLRRPPKEPPMTTRYRAGHLLQLFVVFSFSLAAIASVNTWFVDRTGWATYQLLFTASSVSLSTIAGWGHLYLAWRDHPRRWRWLVFLSFASVPVSFFLRA